MDKEFQLEINDLVSEIDQNLSNISDITSILDVELQLSSNDYLKAIEKA